MGKLQGNSYGQGAVGADAAKLWISSKQRRKLDPLTSGESQHLGDYGQLDETLPVLISGVHGLQREKRDGASVPPRGAVDGDNHSPSAGSGRPRAHAGFVEADKVDRIQNTDRGFAVQDTGEWINEKLSGIKKYDPAEAGI